jgi:SNF2 family DNA or RNA helicase
MSEAEIGLHQMLLRELQAEDKASRFLTVLHRFAQLSQHPALLAGDGEDASPTALIADSSKLGAIIQELHKIRGQREKAIIFSRHRTMQSILAKVLAYEFQLPVRIINGDTKMKASSLRTQGAKTRSAILNEFKAKPGFNIVILSPFVAGIGLTITEANHVFHYGRWWNPAVESQATDRAYRIGQTKEVSVYIPILRDPSGRVAVTFDERLDALMERKYRLAEDFLRPLPPEEDIGGELLGALRNEKAGDDSL